MINRKLFLPMLLMTLSCCTSADIPLEPTNEIISGEHELVEYSLFHNLAENDSFYYSTMNGYLYCAEKKDMEPFIVCGKVNCNHDDEDCNAYVDLVNPFGTVRFWNGQLYIVEEKEETTNLVRVSLNGAEHVTVYSFPERSVSNLVFAGDYFYYYTWAEFIEADGDVVQTKVIYRVDMKSKEREMIYRCEEGVEELERILPCNNGIYFISYFHTLQREKVNYYNAETNELAEDIISSKSHICYYDDESIFYVEFPGKENELSCFVANTDGKDEKQLLSLDFKDGAISVIMNTEYILVKDSEDNSVLIYQTDGEFVSKVAWENAEDYGWYGIDMNYVYYYDYTQSGIQGKRIRMDIGALVSGERIEEACN